MYVIPQHPQALHRSTPFYCMHYQYMTDLFRKGCLFKQFRPLDFHQGNGVVFFKFNPIRVQMNA